MRHTSPALEMNSAKVFQSGSSAGSIWNGRSEPLGNSAFSRLVISSAERAVDPGGNQHQCRRAITLQEIRQMIFELVHALALGHRRHTATD
ncbi:hypothetical protein CFB46_34635 [Burkholderia sp. HI2761]|nr:hypothetical protein CFB46_34635 [Burkholderia sp. HI2761]